MATYRDAVQKIRAMRAELNMNYSIMSPYERQRIESAIESQTAMTRGLIVQGALQDWNAALASHKAASAALDAARKREAARWQPDRLAMEFTLARAAFDRSQSVKEAQAEYQRAMDSGDVNKQRAYSEVFGGALNKFTADRLNAHRLSVDAARKAEALQTTPEIIAAQERGADAVTRVVNLQQEIGAISQEIGASGDLYRELNRAQVHTSYDADAGRWATSVQIQEGEKATA